MIHAMLYSPFFGLTTSLVAWCIGVKIQKKTGLILCNPLVIASVLILIGMNLFHIPLECYEAGGEMIQLMLGPVTAILALNIYQQRTVLKEYFVPVVAGCFVGSVTSIASVYLLCNLFGLDEALTASLIPKSVTTAIALGIAESRGGIQGIAAAGVIVAGVCGAIFAPLFAKLFHITEPVAEGLAIGASSHALGTTKAMEIGSVQGAMSSIAICVCGIMTSVLVLFL